MKNRLSEKEKSLIELSKEHVQCEMEYHFKPPTMALLGEVNRLYHIFLKQNAGVMREARLGILRTVGRKEGCTQREIVEKIHLSAPTVSCEIAQMEEEGLVFQKKKENDSRAFCVYLTESGEKELQRTREEFAILENEILKTLPEEEKMQFVESLLKIREIILEKMDKEEEK